jgi:DNA-binding MarR family transcriptional regulator
MQDKSSRIRDTSTPLALPHAITRLFREQNRLHGRALSPFGLSTEQAHLLLVLWELGPLSMTELGREVALSSGTLSAAIDRMEAAGLVTRNADPQDRRSVRVEPTKWPKEQRAKLMEAMLTTQTRMFAPLSRKDQATLYELIARVLDALEPTTGRAARR